MFASALKMSVVGKMVPILMAGLDEADLDVELAMAQTHNPETGFYSDPASVLAIREELRRRQTLARHQFLSLDDEYSHRAYQIACWEDQIVAHANALMDCNADDAHLLSDSAIALAVSRKTVMTSVPVITKDVVREVHQLLDEVLNDAVALH